MLDGSHVYVSEHVVAKDSSRQLTTLSLMETYTGAAPPLPMVKALGPKV
jgi:hypothetical protein